jgi:hypothetical protein
MDIRLPIDAAWEQSIRHTAYGAPGAVQVTLSKYKIGVHRNYSLVAVNYVNAEPKIFAAVQVADDDPVTLKHPAEELNVYGRFIGIPVKNAHQAGTVIHVIEDAAKNGMHAVEAVNYIASRWE